MSYWIHRWGAYDWRVMKRTDAVRSITIEKHTTKAGARAAMRRLQAAPSRDAALVYASEVLLIQERDKRRRASKPSSRAVSRDKTPAGWEVTYTDPTGNEGTQRETLRSEVELRRLTSHLDRWGYAYRVREIRPA